MRILSAILLLAVAGCYKEAETVHSTSALEAPAIYKYKEISAYERLSSSSRVLFLGDSIVAHREPYCFVNLVRERLTAKYPGIAILNGGVSSDNLNHLQQRWHYDVLPENPTLLVILESIDDVRPRRNNLGSIRNNYLGPLTQVPTLQAVLAQSPCPVVLCTPAIMGEKHTNQWDKNLDDWADAIHKVAAEKRLRACDLRRVFKAYLATHNPENKEEGILTVDGCHYSKVGHHLAADAILTVIDPHD